MGKLDYIYLTKTAELPDSKAPTVPQNISANAISTTEIDLSWDSSTDNETPSAGLTYNAYVKNESGDIIWNSLADSSNGYRYIPALGNAQQNTSWSIRNLPDGNYYWSVQALDNNFAGSQFAAEGSFLIGTTGIEESGNPATFSLSQNYPNPFNPTTTINYSIPKKGNVSLKVFDVLGNEIKTLVNEEKLIGNFKVEFDATNLASGIYLYNLQIGEEYSETKKMILIK